MPTDVALPDALEAEVRKLGGADILVGVPSSRTAATIGHVPRAAPAGLVHASPDSKPVLVNADAGSPRRLSLEVIDMADAGRPPMSDIPEYRTRLGLA